MTTATIAPDTTDCTRAQRVTKSLLGYGVLAGVVFEASIAIRRRAPDRGEHRVSRR